MFWIRNLGSIIAAISVSVGAAHAQSIKLTIPTLPAPSLGAFMGPVIKAEKFDEQNGLDLTFVQKPTARTGRILQPAPTSLVGAARCSRMSPC